MATLMVVDDNPTNLTLLSGLLLPSYAVRAVMSGERALQALAEGRLPDLILLDLKLSGMDGFEVLRRLKADAATADIPVIIVTAVDDGESEERGLALGAADYLTKPLRPRAALARVRLQLELKAAHRSLLGRNAALEAQVQERLRENSQMQDASILALAQLAETRDPETGNHLRRTQGYMRVLCTALKDHPRFAHYLTPQRTELLVKSAPLHDIGKVGIPDQILLKPGPLSPEEWIVMKTHCRLGAAAIESAEAGLAQALPLLTVARQIVHHHHEKWDGSGYPERLAGDAIPIPARLMALADVFDALISRRPYKEPYTLAHATAIIIQGKGQHFDPDVVDAFVAHQADFNTIAKALADSPEDLQAHLARLAMPGAAPANPAAAPPRADARPYARPTVTTGP